MTRRYGPNSHAPNMRSRLMTNTVLDWLACFCKVDGPAFFVTQVLIAREVADCFCIRPHFLARINARNQKTVAPPIDDGKGVRELGAYVGKGVEAHEPDTL